MKLPWFARWFGEDYKCLYAHRDQKEADAQVHFLVSTLKLEKQSLILDLGCGAGRHMGPLRKQGYRVFGLDLSPVLLRTARESKHPVLRSDMRYPALKESSFSLVASFFTSFGYFDDSSEDEGVLHQVAGLLKPGACFFLDLPDKTKTLKSLVSQDSLESLDLNVSQRRRVEGDVILKQIEIRRANGEVQHFEERVRLYELEAVVTMAAQAGLTLQRAYGSFHAIGNSDSQEALEYQRGESDRMMMFFRKQSGSDLNDKAMTSTKG